MRPHEHQKDTQSQPASQTDRQTHRASQPASQTHRASQPARQTDTQSQPARQTHTHRARQTKGERSTNLVLIEKVFCQEGLV